MVVVSKAITSKAIQLNILIWNHLYEINIKKPSTSRDFIVIFLELQQNFWMHETDMTSCNFDADIIRWRVGKRLIFLSDQR